MRVQRYLIVVGWLLLSGCATPQLIPMRAGAPLMNMVGYLTLHVDGHPVNVSLTHLGSREGVWAALKLDERGEAHLKARQSSCDVWGYPEPGKWAGTAGLAKINGDGWFFWALPRVSIPAARAEAECLRQTGVTMRVIEER